MPDRKSDVYEDVYFSSGRKRLTNGEFASICQKKDSKKMYARYAVNTESKEELFFIKMHAGQLIDPYNPTNSKSKRYTYKRVSAKNFRKYVKYLQNGTRYLYKEITRDIENR